MVLAQREHLDVLHHHHLVVIHVKERGTQNLLRILMISLGQESHRLLHSLWRPQQPIARRILVEAREQLSIKLLGGVPFQSLGSRTVVGFHTIYRDVVNRLDCRSRVCFHTSAFSHAPPPLHIQKSCSQSLRSECGRACPGATRPPPNDESPDTGSRSLALPAGRADRYSGSPDETARPPTRPPGRPDRPCSSPCRSRDQSSHAP